MRRSYSLSGHHDRPRRNRIKSTHPLVTFNRLYPPLNGKVCKMSEKPQEKKPQVKEPQQEKPQKEEPQEEAPVEKPIEEAPVEESPTEKKPWWKFW